MLSHYHLNKSKFLIYFNSAERRRLFWNSIEALETAGLHFEAGERARLCQRDFGTQRNGMMNGLLDLQSQALRIFFRAQLDLNFELV